MRYERRDRTLRAVLDTCVLKLGTLLNPTNKPAVIVELCLREVVHAYAFAATAIKHEPDNRFLECALACRADYLITVNTARGHFDRGSYGNVPS